MLHTFETSMPSCKILIAVCSRLSRIRTDRGGTVAAVMGDWVVIQTNGAGISDVPPSEVAISQANSSKVTRIDRIPLQPEQVSYIPNFGVMDLPNNRIYGMDEGPGKVVGTDFDQKTGNMSVVTQHSRNTVIEWLNR